MAPHLIFVHSVGLLIRTSGGLPFAVKQHEYAYDSLKPSEIRTRTIASQLAESVNFQRDLVRIRAKVDRPPFFSCIGREIDFGHQQLSLRVRGIPLDHRASAVVGLNVLDDDDVLDDGQVFVLSSLRDDLAFVGNLY